MSGRIGEVNAPDDAARPRDKKEFDILFQNSRHLTNPPLTPSQANVSFDSGTSLSWGPAGLGDW